MDVDTSLLSTLAKNVGQPDREHDADDVIVNMKSTPAETRILVKSNLQRPRPGDPVLQQPYALQHAQGGQQRPQYGGGHGYGNTPPQGAQGVNAHHAHGISNVPRMQVLPSFVSLQACFSCWYCAGNLSLVRVPLLMEVPWRSCSRNKRAAHDLPGAARERTRGCCGKIPKSGWIKTGRRPQAPNSSLLIFRLRKVC